MNTFANEKLTKVAERLITITDDVVLVAGDVGALHQRIDEVHDAAESGG